jgi:8-oxo-dGTP pyrophosphatase MutT (NUDIX family)
MPKHNKHIAKTKNKKPSPYVTTETINGRMFELTCFEPMHPFDIFRAKRIKVIAFDDEGKVLAIRKRKKIDIISGTTGCDDRNYKDAARREAREEANVTLGRLHLAAVIESIPKDNSSAEVSFILVMTARAKGVIPYSEYQQPNKRYFLTKENLLKRYSGGKPDDLAKLIEMADFVLADAPECDPYIKSIIENF